MDCLDDGRRKPISLPARRPPAWAENIEGKIQDGPLARHPDDIAPNEQPNAEFPPGMSKRIIPCFERQKQRSTWNLCRLILTTYTFNKLFSPLAPWIWQDPAVDSATRKSRQRWRALLYQRGAISAAWDACPLGMLKTYGQDWKLNAVGIYYRHFFSPHWVTAGRKLWIPSLDGIDWTGAAEKPRRERAKTFVRHALVRAC